MSGFGIITHNNIVVPFLVMSSSDYEGHDELTEETLKPVNKVRSKLDKELQEWEVESTKDGQDSQGSG